ncbi:MAG TPA: hypothetical protein VIV11_41870 [Kofleriaceae bacterium]
MRATSMFLLGGATLVGVVIAKLAADSGESAPDTARIAERTGDPVGLEAQRSADVRATHALPQVPAAEPEPPRSRDDQVARSQAQIARIDEDLATRLRAEAVDSAWANQTEGAIASTVASSGLKLESVRCGSTLCRIGVSANDQVAELDLVLEKLTMAEAFRHGGFLRHTGPREVTMFVARKGHKLPRAPRS